jgi:hypothetical protein
MKKKKKDKATPESKKKMDINARSSSEDNFIPEEKPFDFGGLPNRDLKKNLGCG